LNGYLLKQSSSGIYCSLDGGLFMKEKQVFVRNLQYYKFCAYGFLKDLRFYEPFIMLVFLGKGLSFVQIGTLYAVREIFINVMEIPSGLLADTMGRRLTMIASFASYIFSFLIFYAAQDFKILLLAMIAYAFGDAFRTGTHKAMIFDYLHMNGWDDQRTHYYGHTRAWSQRGAALSALIAAFLVFWQGSYAPIFLFTIIPYVLNMVLILSYPKALDGPRHTSDRTLKQEFTKVARSLLDSLKNGKMLKAISSQALLSGYYKAFKDYLQPILKAFTLSLPILLGLAEQERTAIMIGIVYFLLYLSTAFASSRSGKFSERFKELATPLNLTLLVGLVLGLLSGLFLHLSFSAIAVLLYLGIYLLENLRKPMGIAYVSSHMKQDSLASALSVESQVESIFAAVIAMLLGLFSTLFGIGLGILIVSALCLVVSFFLQLQKKESAV